MSTAEEQLIEEHPPVLQVTRTDGSNEVPVEDKQRYVFDDPEIQIPTKRGGLLITHVLRKPELKDYLLHEEANQRVSQVSEDQSMTSQDTQSEANSELYDRLILRAEARVIGDKTFPPKQSSAEEARRYAYEEKDKVYARMSKGNFKVERQVNDDPYAILFESTGETLVVTQKIGENPDAPDFELTYYVTAPTAQQRRDYNRGKFKVKRKLEGNQNRFETHFSVRNGATLFNQIFQKVEGGQCCNQPSELAPKREVMDQVDAQFKNGLAEAVVLFYEKPEGN